MASNGHRLVVDHLGPVVHAEVALRPLTILIGRNNTGKTYVAQALYACRQAVHSIPPPLPDPLEGDELEELPSLLVALRRRSTDNGPATVTLPDRIHGYLTRKLTAGLESAGGDLDNRLQATFGVDDLAQISSWSNSGNVRLEFRQSQHRGPDVCLYGGSGTSLPVGQLLRDLKTDAARTRVFASQPSLFEAELSFETNQELLDSLLWALLNEYWAALLEHMEVGGNIHYLPAGRSGLLNAWTDVVKLRIQLERERLGLPSIGSPSLDGVALDFISSLAGVLGDRPRYRGRYLGLVDPFMRHDPDAIGPAKSLLQELMEGTISAEGDEIVPTLKYRQGDRAIAIRHASSMVADLAPLAIWIDRLIAPGDLLIVDEPESHLHPEAIRLVARVLIRLANSGVRVVCATHSSVLLHEISNCVLRDATAAEAERGYTDHDRLAVDNLAVHSFKRRASDGVTQVEQVTIDPQFGIPEDEFLKVAEDLTDDSARLLRQFA